MDLQKNISPMIFFCIKILFIWRERYFTSQGRYSSFQQAKSCVRLLYQKYISEVAASVWAKAQSIKDKVGIRWDMHDILLYEKDRAVIR